MYTTPVINNKPGRESNPVGLPLIFEPQPDRIRRRASHNMLKEQQFYMNILHKMSHYITKRLQLFNEYVRGQGFFNLPHLQIQE